MKPLGIYIHIPFCIKKCAYCDFYSLRYTSYEREKSYINALIAHIKKDSVLYKDYLVDTVFLGGGTPSILSTKSIKSLTECLKNSFNLSDDLEFTLEANPGTLHKEKLLCYLENGINRLSIGLQSTNKCELERLGRIHSYEDFKISYELARECGFKNISVDVMYGLPEQNTDKFLKTLEDVAEINPEHISAYGLKIEDNTFFGAIKDKLILPGDEEEEKMYLTLCHFLEERGWKQYEISNFAKEGYESRHNMKYWCKEEYIGFGPNAHSYFDGVRYYYKGDINSYIESANNGNVPRILEEEKAENVSLIDEMDEYVMLRLRLRKGVSDAEFESRYGLSFIDAYPLAIKFLKSGHMANENGSYYLTPEGLIVSNYIFVEILHF